MSRGGRLANHMLRIIYAVHTFQSPHAHACHTCSTPLSQRNAELEEDAIQEEARWAAKEKNGHGTLEAGTQASTEQLQQVGLCGVCKDTKCTHSAFYLDTICLQC